MKGMEKAMKGKMAAALGSAAPASLKVDTEEESKANNSTARPERDQN